jgi:hypothetical protein
MTKEGQGFDDVKVDAVANEASGIQNILTV